MRIWLHRLYTLLKDMNWHVYPSVDSEPKWVEKSSQNCSVQLQVKTKTWEINWSELNEKYIITDWKLISKCVYKIKVLISFL